LEDLNDFVFFAKVVEHNGFSAAGRHLGIPKSRLSRRIAQLEERLGVRLLQRSSRRLTLTSVGQMFYERCQAVVTLAESANEMVQQTVSEPQGLLRVSCPMTLAQFWLTPLLVQFMREFSRVRVLLTVTDRRVDPIDEYIDVVLRVRRPPFDDSSLVVRRLAGARDVLVVSAALSDAITTLSDPQDIARWPTLSLPGRGDRHSWKLVNGDTTAEVAHTPRFVTEDMLALKRAAMEGLGLALLPEMICQEELRQGLLRVVLPDWASGTGEVQVAFASRRGMMPAVRAFIDFLVDHPPGALTTASKE
jgi:DNA-binding transcriptional LysR family regulator